MFDSKKLLDALVSGSSENTAPIREKADGLAKTLKDILKQSVEGVKEGADDISDATGADDALKDVIGQYSSGQSAEDLLNRAKELIGENPAAAGAIAGVLGALLLGTKSGRSLATGAAKLGGLVLISGLAYKAYKNYKNGDPIIATSPEGLETAPTGSGFEEATQSDKNAKNYVRAMIASAAADGDISQVERSTIFGAIKEAGFNQEAADFLSAEFAHPATPADLANLATGEQSALQIYTAARLAIEPDTQKEKDFLTNLAFELALDRDLVEHVNGQVAGLKV